MGMKLGEDKKRDRLTKRSIFTTYKIENIYQFCRYGTGTLLIYGRASHDFQFWSPLGQILDLPGLD